MLETIELHNFKGHRSTRLGLDTSRVHALVGQNSSGKTSMLQAIHYLCRLAGAEFKDVFGYQRSPDYLATVGQNEVSVFAHGFWGNGANQKNWQASYKFCRHEDTTGWLPTASWKVDQHSNSITGWSESLRDAYYPIPVALQYSVHLKLVANNLARAAYSDAITPRVEYDGAGLAPTLDYLEKDAPNEFQQIEDMLRRIVPGVKRVGIRRAIVPIQRQRLIEVDGRQISYEEQQEVSGQEVVLDMNSGDRIPAHAISEGTMLTLGILTVLMNPRHPNLMLLDDVEQGLHPRAQRELISVFKEIVQSNPNLQIIFSTHSPYIVDELAPSQVHVMNIDDGGFVRTRRLDNHPDIEWAYQTLTTGEFWGAEGEDWVLAGAPNG